jgi:hypothetical protein
LTQTVKEERKPDFFQGKKLKQDQLQQSLSCKWTPHSLVVPNYVQYRKGKDLRRLNSGERKIMAHLWNMAGKGEVKPFHAIIFFHLLSWPQEICHSLIAVSQHTPAGWNMILKRH